MLDALLDIGFFTLQFFQRLKKLTLSLFQQGEFTFAVRNGFGYSSKFGVMVGHLWRRAHEAGPSCACGA